MVFGVKKKFLECKIHDLALFRCKRRCWKAPERYYSEYKEECFKCINEGKYKKVETIEQKKKHFKI
jgi:hypothetical protein